MILDIVRHKFTEALFVLIIFAASSLVAALYTPADAALSAATTEGAPLGMWLNDFAAEHNILAAIISMPLFCYAVLRLTRATIRTKLYPTSTFATMAIASVTLMATTSGADYFKLLVVATLACECLGRLIGCFRPRTKANRLFSAMIAAGCMPLIDGRLTIAILVILTLIVLLRHSVRETIIAIAGALLPLFAVSYIEWCCGGEFYAQYIALWNSILRPENYSYESYATLPRLIFLALLTLMQICSSTIYTSDRMSLGPGVRNAWEFMQISFYLLAVVYILLPSTSVAAFVVVAILSAPMLPLLFLKLPPYLSLLLFAIISASSYLIATWDIFA